MNFVRVALIAAAVALMAQAAVPTSVQAFCGFYVSGADASLYNNATMVVMMREGTKTVLSMQNNYQGPPEAFAMVVPVPTVLQEDNVKTLPKSVFDRVDKLAAPRLVEYWEQDPCAPPIMAMEAMGAPMAMRRKSGAPVAESEDLGVTVEAEFSVAEYDIVILSAKDSTGLDTWLRRERYNIPQGAERVLRGYVEAGTKFFVAKVDPKRVSFQSGKAVLSPLRFHFDARSFSLPIRLGLLNSSGKQDLLVHILARGKRYEVANYGNVQIPTNIRVSDDTRDRFGEFYNALFERTIGMSPRTVVTEYSWDASTCDPCPEPPLTPSELMTLGADVVPGQPYGFVLTRLHHRYGKNDLREDLVFREAAPLVGGRGMPDTEGKLTERGAQAGSVNNFQGRYVILHPWEGAMKCDTPMRGRWGGPPEGRPVGPVAAKNLAMAAETPAPVRLVAMIEEPIPALGLEPGVDPEPVPGETAQSETDTPPLTHAEAPVARSGCASCAIQSAERISAEGLSSAAIAWLTLALLWLRPRRTRPRRND